MAQGAHWFFWLFLIIYLLHRAVEFALDLLNLKAMEAHRGEIPPLFKNSFSPEDYQKSIAYTRAKTYFSWVKELWDSLILWTFILCGAFASFDRFLGHWLSEGSLWRLVAYPFLLGAILYVLHLPFSLYHTFGLEARFGFNKTTPKTYIVDQIKTLALSLVIGGPLLALIFFLVGKVGSYWWVAAWGVMMAFQFLTAALFPVLLAPIFYKFVPLSEGELKDRLTELAHRIQFKMSGIFTIDGSRRSSHSNAFFAGIGKTRRIVLFDTLVQNLSTTEIVSVIAHEMGHNKMKHIQKGLILSALSSLLGLWVLAFCLKWPPFFAAFGVGAPQIAIGFVLFGLVSEVFTFPFNPVTKWISRKHEYEADFFSVKTTGEKETMISSLIKLSKDNLSNLTPHPWYSFYHYSHPTTTERAAAVNRI